MVQVTGITHLAEASFEMGFQKCYSSMDAMTSRLPGDDIVRGLRNVWPAELTGKGVGRTDARFMIFSASMHTPIHQIGMIAAVG